MRFLLPVSSLAASERVLNSFIASLQLGLRLRFGGAVDHLHVTTADEPVQDSVFRKKYLVLYDTVPGGTGYLKHLMKEPSELMDVLRLALDRMKSCPCTQDPDRDGCYSCLFAYRQSYDMQSTSRDEAIRFITRVLEGADKLKKVRTLGDISISSLLESELEELFIEALKKAEVGEMRFSLRKQVVGGSPGYFLKAGEKEWLIEPQVELGEYDGVSIPCRADFVISPAGEMPGVKPIVMFTDGYRYHRDRLARDMAQRTAIIRSGAFSVWSLTWNDIAGENANWYTDYLSSGLTGKSGILGSLLDGFGVRELDSLRSTGSIQWLLRYLAEPDIRSWSAYAYAHALARMDHSIASDANAEFHWKETLRDIAGEVGISIMDDIAEPAQYGLIREDPAVVFLKAGEAAIRESDSEGLRLLLYLDDRVTDPDFREHWNGFLRLHNLFQFLPGCTAVTARGMTGADQTSVPAIVPHPSSRAELSEEWAEVLELAALEVHSLLARVMDAGLPVPDVGWEIVGEDGTVAGDAELVWEDARVALLCEPQLPYRDEFTGRGWKVFTPEQEEEKAEVFISTLRTGIETGERG